MKPKTKPNASGLKGEKLNYYTMQLSYKSVNLHAGIHLELCRCRLENTQGHPSPVIRVTIRSSCTTIITFKDVHQLSIRTTVEIHQNIIGFPLEHPWTSVSFHTDVHPDLLWTSIRILKDVRQLTYGHQSGPL